MASEDSRDPSSRRTLPSAWAGPPWSCWAATATVTPRSWWGVIPGHRESGSRTPSSRGSARRVATPSSPGIEPTPAIAFMTTDLGASSGVVISASHNPPEYNGIKFFDARGMKLADEIEDEIEVVLDDPWSPSDRSGQTLTIGDERERYLAHLIEAAEAPLDGMRVVVDCANGAASDAGARAPAPTRRDRVRDQRRARRQEHQRRRAGRCYPEVVAAEVVRRGRRRRGLPRRRCRPSVVRRCCGSHRRR